MKILKQDVCISLYTHFYVYISISNVVLNFVVFKSLFIEQPPLTVLQLRTWGCDPNHREETRRIVVDKILEITTFLDKQTERDTPMIIKGVKRLLLRTRVFRTRREDVVNFVFIYVFISVLSTTTQPLSRPPVTPVLYTTYPSYMTLPFKPEIGSLKLSQRILFSVLTLWIFGFSQTLPRVSQVSK